MTFTTFGKGYDPNSHAAAFDERFPGKIKRLCKYTSSDSLKIIIITLRNVTILSQSYLLLVIDFTTSRRLHYLSKHKKERTKADRDEFNLVQESKRK